MNTKTGQQQTFITQTLASLADTSHIADKTATIEHQTRNPHSSCAGHFQVHLHASVPHRPLANIMNWANAVRHRSCNGPVLAGSVDLRVTLEMDSCYWKRGRRSSEDSRTMSEITEGFGCHVTAGQHAELAAMNEMNTEGNLSDTKTLTAMAICPCSKPYFKSDLRSTDD